MGDFDQFRALSFDCYGTLIDWETGIRSALSRWAASRGVDISSDELLGEFSEIETVVEQERTPAPLYPEVLAETLRRIGARCGAIVSEDDARAFGASVPEWPAFPDSADALSWLKQRFRLIIVSNVDSASFAASNALLGVEFDRIITASEVGAYKPSPAHFEELFASLPALGVRRSELLHVAQSLFHDHEPAARYGLPSVWIDRRRDQRGPGATPSPTTESVRPRWRFPTLASFAKAVDVAG
jgi:putative hydrolase of the HAD superfamily